MKRKVHKKFGKRITLDEMLNRIRKVHGNSISMTNYVMATEKANFHCNVCGYDWITTPMASARGNGCNMCGYANSAEKNKSDLNDIKNFINDNNCEYISGEYKNNRSKMTIRFDCGHIGNINFNDFKAGNRCYFCGRKKSNLSKRVPLDVIMEIIKNNEFKFISFPNGYINRSSEIEFICKFDHHNQYKIREFLKNHNCRECTRIRQIINQTGSKGSNWQGGLTVLKSFLSKYIKDWKKDSMKNSDYKCVISGERFQDIHHLQSFNLLLKECLNELGLNFKNTTGEYSENELFLLANKIKEIHYRYPLGVCLTKKWHNKFHQEYGIGDNTPEQFYDFKNRIASGEITI